MEGKRGCIKPKKGYCIGCENRHGCKSKTPPCITQMEENDVANMSGKQYFMDGKKTGECKDCPFFRTCWKIEEYNRLTK